jgi:hypothetical protein
MGLRKSSFEGSAMGPSSWGKAILACVGSMLVTALLAAFLARHGALFVSNFAFFWLPTVATLLLVTIFRAPPAVTYGVAGAICAILVFYAIWVRTIPAQDSALAWAGYLLCMPGAAAGAMASLLWARFRATTAARAACVAFAATAAGFAIGMALFLSAA